MSAFGQTLFGGSPFIRFMLTPCVLIFAIFFPFALDDWTWLKALLLVGMELGCVALLAGLWLPARWGQWAFRVLASLVFLAYAAYLIYEFYFSHHKFHLTGHRSEASRDNALRGFIIIGLPCLWFAIFGRLSFKPAEPENNPEEEEPPNRQQ